jgi:2-oxoisovalerate dehydrogenase E1 component
MLNRAEIIARNFNKFVASRQLPRAQSSTTPEQAGLSQADCLHIFMAQLYSRHLDLTARALKQTQQCYYTIGSSGHEGNAAIAYALRADDMAFLHYRSAAFMLERLRQAEPNSDAIYHLLLGFIASQQDPVAGGRHKVFGSLPGLVPPQTSTIASHLPKAVGAAFSIHLAKELNLSRRLADDSVVLCSFGDASLNHSVAQGALNATQFIAYENIPLPLLLVCEDNGIGISVPTPKHWVQHSMQARSPIQYLACDGLNFADVYQQTQQAQYIARVKKQPVLLHMRCVRLLGHAGSDIEHVYRSEAEIIAQEQADPLLHSARILLDNEYFSAEEIIALNSQAADQVAAAASQALHTPTLSSKSAVMAALIPKPATHAILPLPSQAQRLATFAEQSKQLSQPRNLSQCLNLALTDLLLQYPSLVIFGEDVARKGGVYHVTAGLMQKFGQRRVFDSLLDETTILGQAIGMAHNGILPMPEIQFLAYYHNAEDQIRGEAASLSFFSNQQFTNPMLVRIASFAYQQGFGGHFHNDNSLAVLRDVPGVIIACPSRGDNAAKLLRECVRLAYQAQRVVIFLEPIALYMQKDLHAAGDGLWLCDYPAPQESIALGEITTHGTGQDVVIITYANGVHLSLQAQKNLQQQHGIDAQVIDLHWLAPLPEAALLSALANCSRVLVVDECRQTGSLSETLLSLLLEKLSPLPCLRRICAADCFIPLGTSWQYLLPSVEQIVSQAQQMIQEPV